jgi:AmmeMemoRadiSam system protein A
MVENYTPEEQTILLKIVRTTLETATAGQATPLPDLQTLPEALREPRACFVTLHTRDGELRGCTGTLTARRPLAHEVSYIAIQTAFHDPRFRPLTVEELDRVTIEVSVLTEPQPLNYEDAADLVAKLRPNVDGVILRKGYASATFLPQVWEQLPKPEAFLSHLCLKAGLSADAWRKGRLEVQTYQVQYFEEPH